MTMERLDQTRGETIPRFSDDQPAHLSCNEAAALCMKAARGTGMSWGMAEEAGFAVSWLLRHGIDGPTLLRQHLDRNDGRAWSDLCPHVAPGQWRKRTEHPTCPICLGASLGDFAGLPQGLTYGPTLCLGEIGTPVLLLPFLAQIGLERRMVLTLTSDRGQICLGDRPDWVRSASDALDGTQITLSLTAQNKAPVPPRSSATGNALTIAASVDRLNSYALRTTVPATEASRAGAGSALSDND